MKPVVARRVALHGSNRSFGLVFAATFALIGLWPLLNGGALRSWALILAAAFLAAGVLRPQLLSALNQLWFRFGELLRYIINPVLLFVIYYGAVTPVGLSLRLLGRDLLRLQRDRAARSYWIIREPPGPATGSMDKQF